jgi:Spy/CpxP family protein refolding chaperone
MMRVLMLAVAAFAVAASAAAQHTPSWNCPPRPFCDCHPGGCHARQAHPMAVPHCTPQVTKLCGHTCISVHKVCHA